MSDQRPQVDSNFDHLGFEDYKPNKKREHTKGEESQMRRGIEHRTTSSKWNVYGKYIKSL